jgi:hypothetical protein
MPGGAVPAGKYPRFKLHSVTCYHLTSVSSPFLKKNLLFLYYKSKLLFN